MTSSTDLKSVVLKKVRSLYKVASKAEFLEDVRGGYLSQNFILRNNKTKLFLKRYRFQDVEKVEQIHRVKFFFAKGGIPIILPIQNNQKEYYFEHDGEFYSLFPFVSGKIVARADRSPKAFASAGSTLARIHLLSKNGFPKIIDDYAKGWDKEAFLSVAREIEARIGRVEPKSNFDKLAVRVLQFKKKLVLANNLQYMQLGLENDHLIHGDYHGENIFYDDNDTVRAVFDLEKSEIAPRVFELVRSTDFMCFSNDYDRKNFNDAYAYLSAYATLYPISRDELARGIQMYYLKKAHSLWIEKEHYLKKNFRVDHFLEVELQTLQYYSQNLTEFTEKVTKGL
jgi:Ser/Thr protein kinase RdoA (MazF antagonist)